MHTRAYTVIHIWIHTYTHTARKGIVTYTHTNTHIHTHTRAQTPHTHRHTHTCTHTHTHAHTHTNLLKLFSTIIPYLIASARMSTTIWSSTGRPFFRNFKALDPSLFRTDGCNTNLNLIHLFFLHFFLIFIIFKQMHAHEPSLFCTDGCNTNLNLTYVFILFLKTTTTF